LRLGGRNALLRGRFTTGAARGVTTQLVLQISEDIFLVHAGISLSIVMDDNMTNAMRVLWANFQTHDLMLESLTFKIEEPAVAHKLYQTQKSRVW
jgi:hypothetical protein